MRFGKNGQFEEVSATELRKGDVVAVRAGEVIPSDGDVIEGAATVDESAITGESAPVIWQSGGYRSTVTGGTRVLSDEIKIRVSVNPGEGFLDRMISLVEGAQRQKTPNEIALTILLAALTVIPAGLRHADAVRHLFRRHIFRAGVDRVAGLPDSDDDWRVVERHRYRGHGSFAATQRARDERPRGGGGGQKDVPLLDKTGTIYFGQRSHRISPRRESRKKNWPMPPSCLHWRTKRWRAAASWCWRKKSASASVKSRKCLARNLSPLPPKPA